jgi:hypothetical protein
MCDEDIIIRHDLNNVRREREGWRKNNKIAELVKCLATD